MPSLTYYPERERCQKQSKTNKQGSDTDILDADEWLRWSESHNNAENEAWYAYRTAQGVDLSRELARISLPLSTYTYWYWKIDLHNLMHFLWLRLDKHAQWEIRQYAKIMAAIVKDWVPNVWEAFVDYRLSAVTFSRMERVILKRLIEEQDFAISECEALGMTKREIAEFKLKLCDPDEEIYTLPEPRDGTHYEKLIQDNATEVVNA